MRHAIQKCGKKPAPALHATTVSENAVCRVMLSLNLLTAVLLATLTWPTPPSADAGDKPRVGSHLYAPVEALKEFEGSLKIKFETPGDRLVVAYGYRNRKVRKSRADTTEAERHQFKPVKAEMRDDGRLAVFPHLAPDFYDVFVVVPNEMQFYEGLSLHRTSSGSKDIPVDEYLREVGESLSVDSATGRGWEAFFDTKTFERLETDGQRGGVLLQQVRRGTALTAAGAVIDGCIHSIDICWVERTKAEGKDESSRKWQVLDRQQLYREELDTREFFEHHYVPRLHRILIGTRARDIGPITLPRPTQGTLSR